MRVRNAVLWLSLAFLLLVGALGVFQWRLLREVYWYEVARQHGTLEGATLLFQREVEEEIGALADVLNHRMQVDGGALHEPGLSEALEAWRQESAWPDLVHGVFRTDHSGVHVERLDHDGTWSRLEESSNLAKRALSVATRTDTHALFSYRRSGLLFDTEGLGFGRRSEFDGTWIAHVLLLRRDVLFEGMLRDVASWTFHPRNFGDQVDFLIVDRRKRQVLFESRSGLQEDDFGANSRAIDLFVHRPGSRRTPRGVPRGDRDRYYDLLQDRRWDGELLLVVRAPHRPLPRGVAGLRLWETVFAFVALAFLGAAFAGLLSLVRESRRLAAQQLDMIARVAHELRTPVAVVAAAGDNLADGLVVGQERIRSYGEQIRAESARLSEMVENTLRLAAGEKEGGPAVERTELIEQIRQFSDVYAVRLERDQLELELDLPEADLWVEVDRGGLRRALANLLSNAHKYGAQAGRIRVHVHSEDGQTARIVVTNPGGPIDITEAEELWQPYRRGSNMKTSTHGAGLGLAVVREFARSHGGDAQFDLAQPGTVGVVLTIPMAEGGADLA